MTIKSILLITLFLFINTFYGQDNNSQKTCNNTNNHCCNIDDNMKVIKLNFENKTIDLSKVNKSCKLKEGDLYQIQVDHINLNLYNVAINKKDSIIPTSVTFPTIDLLGIDNINKVIGSIVTSTSAKQITTDQIQQVKDEISALNYQKAENQYKLANKELYFGEINDEQLQKMQIEIEQNIINLKNKQQQLEHNLTQLTEQMALIEDPKEKILNQINDLKNEVKKELNLAKSPTHFSDSVLLKLNSHVLAYKVSLTSETKESKYLDNSDISFEIIFTSLDSIVNRFNDIEKSIKQLQSNYKEYSESLLKDPTTLEIVKKDSLTKLKMSELTKNITDAIATIEKSKSKISKDKIISFYQKLLNLENNKDRTYTSLPQQFNGDINKIKISITPKDSAFGPSYEATYQIPKQKTYTGIDGGFYYAFDFINATYSTTETPSSDTTSTFQVVSENKSRGEIGFTTLLHVGTKPCEKADWFGINFATGPAISLSNKPQLRLSMGGGISLGRAKNMLSLSFLGMAGYVQRLSNVYSEGTNYGAKPEQVTISKLKTSYALSIGYIYKF